MMHEVNLKCFLKPSITADYTLFLWQSKFHYHFATFLQGFFHYHILNKFSLTKIKTRVDLNLIISCTFEYLTSSKSRIYKVHCLLEEQSCQLVSRHSHHHLFNSLTLSYAPLKSFFFLASQLAAMPSYPYLTMPSLFFTDLRRKNILLISILSLLQFNVSFEQGINTHPRDMLLTHSCKCMRDSYEPCLCLFVDIYIFIYYLSFVYGPVILFLPIFPFVFSYKFQSISFSLNSNVDKIWTLELDCLLQNPSSHGYFS